MRNAIARFLRDETGATAIEYGLIISLIVVVILTALTAFGGTSTGIFNTAMDSLRSAMGG
jgi:pilus assembly protein Flp/PilA